MKVYLATLLAITLTISAHAQFIYSMNNSNLTITGYTGPGGNLTLPAAEGPLPVTAIGDQAFFNCTNLTSVIIPENIARIGYRAFFACTSLTNVSTPNSLTNIDDYAFDACDSLSNVVTFPEGLTHIGIGAFADCPLPTVTLGQNVNFIGFAAFRCSGSLTSITVSPLNSTYSSVDGVLFDKAQTQLLQYPRGKPGDYTVPAGTAFIAPSAFLNCRLTGLTLPEGVTNLGFGACSACWQLRGVNLPNTLTAISNSVFYNCSRLTTVVIPASVTFIDYQAFGNDYLTGVYYQGAPPFISFGAFTWGPWFRVYRLPGAQGWDSSVPLWNPVVQSGEAGPAVRTNLFGFTIVGTSNILVAVDACTDLAHPVWVPLRTNSLTGGSWYFTDPQWTNSPGRFYRLHSP